MKRNFLYLTLLISAKFYSQSFTEPSKITQFNITVNFSDHTVKTQMLSHPKKFDAKSELTYMWYASQKIMETKGGFDGKLIHGAYRSFYLNEQLREQGKIKYGLRNKVWKYWYSNGNIKESITWKDGVKAGVYCIYNDDGKLMAKSNFKNDKLNGHFYTYDVNGKVLEKKKYSNGEEVLKKMKIPKAPREKKEKKPKLKKEKVLRKRKTVTTEGEKIS